MGPNKAELKGDCVQPSGGLSYTLKVASVGAEIGLVGASLVRWLLVIPVVVPERITTIVVLMVPTVLVLMEQVQLLSTGLQRIIGISNTGIRVHPTNLSLVHLIGNIIFAATPMVCYTRFKVCCHATVSDMWSPSAASRSTCCNLIHAWTRCFGVLLVVLGVAIGQRFPLGELRLLCKPISHVARSIGLYDLGHRVPHVSRSILLFDPIHVALTPHPSPL